jgi:SAM-dependent methyltransferase
VPVTRPDPTRRFSSRVEHYARYRPGYPARLIEVLRNTCGLAPDHVVADVGCGTGLLAEVFLRNGNLVYGIEPNEDMRAVAEDTLRKYERFRSVNARGECTTLPRASVDLVAVGRAFQWLEPEAALAEFARILKPEGWAVLVWLTRKTAPGFPAEYDGLLSTYSLDRREMEQTRRDRRTLLTRRGFTRQSFDEHAAVTLEALEGETRSYSSSPEPGHPLFAPMREALQALFRKHQRDGQVTIEYGLTVYCKQLAREGPDAGP